MRTIDEKKSLALRMRKEGVSVGSIAQELGIAKSTASSWVRGVTITPSQRKKLLLNAHSQESIEKRRVSRLASEKSKRQKIIDKAQSQVKPMGLEELLHIGTALYWAEGGKTQRMVRFSNGDPEMIALMMRYFREVCAVDEMRFRGHIHIHEDLDVPGAEEYWSHVTQLPKSQFFKTYNKPNKLSKGARTTLPHGVCDVYVMDVTLFLKIQGWTKAIISNYKIC